MQCPSSVSHTHTLLQHAFNNYIHDNEQQEQREALLGRVFGLAAIARSGLASASAADAALRSVDCREVANRLW